MSVLIKNRPASIIIRIMLILVVAILAAVLAIKLYGKRELNKAYEHLAKMSKETAPAGQPGTPREQDAIVCIAAGAKSFVMDAPKIEKLKDYANVNKHPDLTSGQIAECESLLAESELTIKMIHKAEGMISLSKPISSWGITFTNIPDNAPQEMLVPSRLLSLEARLAWRKGDAETFVRSMNLQAKWMEAFNSDQTDPMGIEYSQIFGAISENRYMAVLRETFQAGRMTPEMAARILEAFPREDLKKHLHDHFIRVASRAGKGYPEPYNYFIDIREGYEWWRLYSFILGDLANARAMEYFLKTAEACDETYDKAKKSAPSGFFMPTFLGMKWYGESYGGYIGNIHATMAQRQIAKACLTAIIERGRTGEWPSSSSLPSDMDSCTCGRLKYEIKADGSLKLSYPGMVKLCGPKTDKAWNWRISEEWTIPAPGAPTSQLP